MDVVGLLFQFLFRAFVIVLPLTTGWLAFRRLVLSRSSNAWIYAMTCLFAAITAAGLLPWALGLGSAAWIFFVFSAFCPAIWIGVVMMCDMSRSRPSSYEPDAEDSVVTFTSTQKSAPLVLENPDWPGAPIPVFRHNGPANLPEAPGSDGAPKTSEPTKHLLAIAREMRKNTSSDARRPKLLPPPDQVQLPFLNRSH